MSDARAGLPRMFLAIIFGGALLAALLIVNLRFTRTSPGGNDFLPRWLGTRLYLTQNQNPYSLETTAAIQQAMYGRPAKEGEDQALFAYPFYSMLFFGPFSLIDNYAVARAAWITFQELALVATAFAAIALSSWKPGRWPLAAFLFFALAWFHGAKPLVDGNASILVAMLAAFGLLALLRGQDGLAGLLFALASIKPQMVILLVPLVLIWVLSKRRKAVIWAFLISMALLIGASFALQPSWLAENLGQALLYQGYSPPGTLAGILAQSFGDAGRAAGWGINLLFALLLLSEWWNALGKDFDWFVWTACLTLVMGPLVGLPSTTSNYAIFLLVLPWLFARWQRRVGAAGGRMVWFDLGLLFVGLWTLFLFTLHPNQQFGESLLLFFPAPLFLLLNLYWLRWWVQKPQTQSTLKSRAI
jgi:hypothetical protein